MRRGRSGYCRLPPSYTVLVAEKPKAAEKIARALGRSVKCRMYDVPYWIVKVNGSNLVVAPSAGHLYGMYTREKGFPVYTYYWAPIWENERGASYLKKFHLMLSKVLPGARIYINACDYDVEGSLIGYMIIKNMGDPSRAYRMKFSSLGPEEIRRAYRNLQPLDMEMVEAGMARHELDWLWGINISRALMEALKRFSGKRASLSAGRVQSPTLVEAKRRWIEKSLHVPHPSFSIEVALASGGVEFKAKPHGWAPETRQEALAHVRRIRRLDTVKVIASTGRRERLPPPPAFNLGDLQAEASRVYRYSPAKTQSLAEDLYLEGLISYPRTNSQKLPPTIGYKAIMAKLEAGPHSQLVKRLLDETRGALKPVQGRKEDPAHPAIHPTGEKPGQLDRDHWNIYDMIVRRFLAAFSSHATLARTTLILEDRDGYKYQARGVQVVEEGWLYYYHFSKPREGEIPRIGVGGEARVEGAKMQTSWSKPGASIAKIDLLKWMERVNIGTEATRSRIIEVLFKRGYLVEDRGGVEVSDLGFTVATIIEELFPQLASPGLTRQFEEKLEEIREGRASRREVVEEAIRVIDGLIREYQENLERVGARLSQALGLTEPRVRCQICGREARGCGGYTLCPLHCEAVRRVQEALPRLTHAMGEAGDKALERLATMKTAGRLIREAASFLKTRGHSQPL